MRGILKGKLPSSERIGEFLNEVPTEEDLICCVVLVAISPLLLVGWIISKTYRYLTEEANAHDS